MRDHVYLAVIMLQSVVYLSLFHPGEKKTNHNPVRLSIPVHSGKKQILILLRKLFRTFGL